jgi:hypothetical protein
LHIAGVKLPFGRASLSCGKIDMLILIVADLSCRKIFYNCCEVAHNIGHIVA